MKTIAVLTVATCAMVAQALAQEQFAPTVPPPPVVYQAPVVYEAPVIYNAPVVYQAPVIYGNPAGYNTPVAYEYPAMYETAPGVFNYSTNVLIIGDPADYDPYLYDLRWYSGKPEVIHFGHAQACRQGYAFGRRR